MLQPDGMDVKISSSPGYRTGKRMTSEKHLYYGIFSSVQPRLKRSQPEREPRQCDETNPAKPFLEPRKGIKD